MKKSSLISLIITIALVIVNIAVLIMGILIHTDWMPIIVAVVTLGTLLYITIDDLFESVDTADIPEVEDTTKEEE